MLFDSINIDEICRIARQAGEAILTIYQSDFDFETKSDGSPLTLADKNAHDIIEASLQALSPKIPVLSEESIHEIGNERLRWTRYWLVDPLDGTKEFIKRNGEFTVNIALIDQGVPVIGVVFAPVLNTLYFAAKGQGAFKQIGDNAAKAIQPRALSWSQIKIVASRSHLSEEVKQFKAAFESRADSVELISMGSSLKLCLVAEGSADYYPRLGATSEWDTAAAQCVVESAGGIVVDCQNRPLLYTKENILNPWFLVIADRSVNCSCEGPQSH